MNDSANPKDAAGRAKVPLHLWPASATAAGAIGFLEGELKYGRNNFRATPVAASVYVAAAKRHLDEWMEGADVAADTGSPHLGNALACIAILVDAGVNGSLIDDRNYTMSPGAYERHLAELTAQVGSLKQQFAGRTPKHWDARDMRGEQNGVKPAPAQKSSDFNAKPNGTLKDSAESANTKKPLDFGAMMRDVLDGLKADAEPKGKLGTGTEKPPLVDTCNCAACVLERDIRATLLNAGVEVIFIDEETGRVD